MTELEQAREFFMGDVYATGTTGITIDDVSPGYAKCSLVIGPQHLNALGSVMGGALFTLADLTFAVASNWGQPYYTVTTTSSISYLSASRGSKLFAESRCIKNGKALCFYEIIITDDLGAQVAVVNSNGMHIQKK